MKKILFFFFTIVSLNSYAFVCQTTTGHSFYDGVENIYGVPIDSDIFAQPDRINEFADIDDFISCKNEAPSSYIDYLILTGAKAGPKFADVPGLQTGVVINGSYVVAPFSGQTNLVFKLETVTQKLPIKLYLKVNTIPESAILVNQGDLLMTLYLHKYATGTDDNIPVDDNYFEWNFFAANDVIVGTGTCDINNNQIIEIDFGQVGISGVSTTGLDGRYQINKEISYTCADQSLTTPIKMYLTASPAQFSTDAMLVRTGDSYGAGAIMPGLGVEIYREGQVVSPLNGSWSSNITNGIGSDILTFTLVKKQNLVDGDLVEGPFNASGTIVMSSN